MKSPGSYPHLVALLMRLRPAMLRRVLVTSQVDNWLGRELVIWFDGGNADGLLVAAFCIFPIKGGIRGDRMMLKGNLQPILSELRLTRRRPKKPGVANKALTAIVRAAAREALGLKVKAKLSAAAARPKK